jgi:ferrous iron transport protein B
MSWQGLAVALIVPVCALYAAWSLMGAAARRRVGAWLASQPLPVAWRQRLQRGAGDGNACGCDGCDASGAKAAARAVVHVHRRKR